ncbi:DUF4351 domain-containing protein [Nostoc sp.]|uniref:DUF4351 domain-containing protein n=1 Tax=Nostoc sp. TaxID=1180 RepID=UPI002FF9508D
MTQLEDLSEALLDFSTAADLISWFSRPLAKILESPLPNPPRCVGEGARFQVSPQYIGGIKGGLFDLWKRSNNIKES